MSKKTNRRLLGIGGGAGAVTVAFVALLLFGEGGNLVEGNVVPLAFVDAGRDLRCEAWNNLAVTNVNGAKQIIGSSNERFSFLVPDTTLSLTHNGVEIETFHVQLVVECEGDLIEDADGATMRGSLDLLLCGTVDRTRCFVGDDRFFGQLGGQNVGGVEAFSNQQLNQGAGGSNQVVLPAERQVLVWEGDISAQEIDNTFPDGRIHFKSQMLPVLTIDIDHPQFGLFSATYDARAVNDQIIAQYGGLSLDPPPPVDSDGDGIFDNEDACTGQPENFNGFEDDDGCPDVDLTLLDTDNDGINDAVDSCVSQPETVNGFQDTDGCPDVPPPPADSDGDGVIDDLDICKDIEGSQSNGCPPTSVSLSFGGDADGDGVVDEDDRCPTIAGTAGANQGCPNRFGDVVGDDDGDGVVDEFDSCRDTPLGVFVDLDGCETTAPVVDLDLDNDGVLDEDDLCPNTGIGETVDEDGCTLPPLTVVEMQDNDGDGIPNNLDVCPDNAGDLERDGCPANPFDDIVDIITPEPDFQAEPIEPIVQPTPQPTPQPQTTTQPQTTVSGEVTDTDILILIGIMIAIAFVIIIVLTATGKVKL